MSAFNRIHFVVLDSVGVGATPDINSFVNADVPDGVSDTPGRISKAVGSTAPSMAKTGLRNIPRETPLKTVPAGTQPGGYATKLEEVSRGKDTVTGHWRITGLNIAEPLNTFFEGFPEEILTKIEESSGRKIIREVSKPYSGTQVTANFGEHQMRTGKLVVYTSADPVPQIAAHGDIILFDELCKICESARSVTSERPNLFGRIIARPYVGELGNFMHTTNRRNYALLPFAPTVLNKLADASIPMCDVGKISDIFNSSDITNGVGYNKPNMHGVDTSIKTLQLSEFTKGLSFINLVDSDIMYGHRRNAAGYRDCLEEFDDHLPKIVESMESDDLLLTTVGHGNDPTYTGADHARGYIPSLAYSPSFKRNDVLLVGHFTDIPAAIAENFGVETATIGQSFPEKLI